MLHEQLNLELKEKLANLNTDVTPEEATKAIETIMKLSVAIGEDYDRVISHLNNVKDVEDEDELLEKTLQFVDPFETIYYLLQGTEQLPNELMKSLIFKDYEQYILAELKEEAETEQQIGEALNK